MMNDVQSTFLLTLSRLYLETKTYVPESRIREEWPECPPHDVLLDLGLGRYFYQDPDNRRAYMPTENCFSLAEDLGRIMQLSTELQKMHNDFDQYRTDQAAYQASQELNAKKAERRNFWRSIVSGALAGVISGLVVQHWPDILSALAALIH